MIDVLELRFRYPDAGQDALIDLSWRVRRGEFVLVAGQSGSGKSTLLRCLNGLIPHFHGGHFSGDVEVDGRNTRLTPPRELATSIGTVFQDPETQIVTDTAEDEIAFTLENLGHDRHDIEDRTDRVCRELGIEHLRTRRVSTLSGGERQLVALAAALAPRPGAVILDEPTSQLDPSNASAVISALERQSDDRDLTVILAEHRLGKLLAGDRPVLIVSDGSATMPHPEMRARGLIALGLLPPESNAPGPIPTPSPGDVIAALSGIEFAYRRRPVLNVIDLAVHEGETLGLMGANGAGKTTLLKLLIGLLRPSRGTVTVDGRGIENLPVQVIARSVGYVPQQATLMLHQETVEEELDFTLDALNRPGNVQRELETWGLDRYKHAHPLDLSGGERQRLAIAAITVARPRLLLLDEPTRGLPWSMKRDLAMMLRSYAAEGRAVVVATHDEEFVRAFASRRIALAGGRVVLNVHPDNQEMTGAGQNKDVGPLLTTSNFD